MLSAVANEKAQLGERIRAARADKGWKQKHLAAQVDVEPITVSRWERGATTPDLDGARPRRRGDREAGQLLRRRRRDGAGGRSPRSQDDARRRIETAALQIASGGRPHSQLLEELRAELAAALRSAA